MERRSYLCELGLPEESGSVFFFCLQNRIREVYFKVELNRENCISKCVAVSCFVYRALTGGRNNHSQLVFDVSNYRKSSLAVALVTANWGSKQINQ